MLKRAAILAILLSAIFAVGGYTFAYKPLAVKLNATQLQLKASLMELKKAKQLDKSKITAEMEIISLEMNAIKALVPAQFENAKIINSLNEASQKSGVQVKQLKFENPRKVEQFPGYLEYPLHITAIGTLYQQLAFIRYLEQSSPVLKLNSLTLTRDVDSSTNKADYVFSTFVASEEPSPAKS